jgi:hypothetical protein
VLSAYAVRRPGRRHFAPQLLDLDLLAINPLAILLKLLCLRLDHRLHLLQNRSDVNRCDGRGH